MGYKGNQGLTKSNIIMDVGDKVIVPAAINGYGEDLEAWVCRVEPFMSAVLVEVNYCNPTPQTGIGSVYYESQLITKENPL
jgi:hypothetical protein